MKKYNITVNGTTYEVVVEEAGEVTGAPVVTAPAAAPARNVNNVFPVSIIKRSKC